MACKNCSLKPIIVLPGTNNKLCKSCFFKYFEKKAFKTISQFKMVSKGDKIGVAVSGGKDSLTVLNLINKLADKRLEIDVKVIAIDEGIKGYRDLSELKRYCRQNKFDLHIYSYKKEFGYTLDKMVKKLKLKPCTVCGILRRFLLNSKARQLKVNKLVTGHNLDDEAQSVLMNQYKGNIAISARLGPVTGVVKDKRFVPRIKPLYFLSEKEVAVYSFLKNFPVDYKECPYTFDSYRSEVQDMLNDFEQRHPQTKYSIIKSFLDILPLLKKRYKGEIIKACKKCGEPSSSDVCKVCELKDKLRTI